jgi:hypothetical protein
MMTFLAPFWLWLLLLVPPLIALFLVRRRSERRLTSTLAFFLDLHRHYRESPWLRRLKRLLALLLALGALLGLSLALARPVAAPLDEQTDALLVVIDRSASTGARADDERSVLEAGLDALRSQLRALPPQLPVVLIASDAVPQVLLPPGADRREADRICAALRPRALPGNHQQALALARDLASAYEHPAIWMLGDRAGEEEGIRLLALPRPVAGNAGITACRLARRPLEPDQVECFVALQANDARTVELEVQVDGSLVALRRVELAAGVQRALILPLEAGVGAVIELRLGGESEDALAADDRLRLPCPPGSRRRIRLIGPQADPFSELALACLDEQVELELLGPGDWSPTLAPVELTIFHGWVPEALPAVGSCLLIDPPRSCGPLVVRRLERPLTVSDLRVHDPDHPLLVGVASGRVGLLQTATIAEGGLLLPVWSSSAGCVLAAGERDGRRLALLAADPGHSGRLPLEASWPSLLANLVHWSAPPSPLDDACRATGSLILSPEAPLLWDDGSSVAAGSIRLDRQGLWSCGKRAGAAALLSAEETLLPLPDDQAAAADQGAVGSLDWTLLLIILVMGILAVDQWLAHRRGIF